MDEENMDMSDGETLGSIKDRGVGIFPQDVGMPDGETLGSIKDRGVGIFPQDVGLLEASVSRDSPLYSMDKVNKGHVIIFKQENFDMPKIKARKSASHDAQNCKNVFSRVGFRVHEYSDLCKEDFLKTLEKIRNNQVPEIQLDNCSSLIVIFMSHGRQEDDKEYILLRDEEVLTTELWTPFSAEKCPSLASRPKIFFIQACRGIIREPGMTLRERRGWATDETKDHVYTIPLQADMLMMWATYPGMPAHRTERCGIKGSVFIHFLCQVILNDYEWKDLSSMLVRVAHQVGVHYESEAGVKQMPYTASTLMRTLVFSEKARKLYEWLSTREKAEKMIEMIP